MEKNPYEINSNSEKRFYEGKLNKSFRIYAYFQEGLNHVGQFKTIAYFLIGIGLIFNIPQDQYITLAWIGLATFPPIFLLGYVMKTRGNRSMEYFNIRDLSPYGKYVIQMQEKQVKDQSETNEGIKKLIKIIDKLK